MLEELLKQERKRKRKRHTNPLSQINKEIRLEAYTEQSESNPGRSLGITNKEGTAVWKTVPTDYQKPITQNQQPTTDNQQPTTNNQQPTTNNQQPKTDNQ